MTVTSMEIRHNERAGQHTLGLDRATRDALATYANLRWPTGAAKHAAKEWGLTLDEGRGVVSGRTSQATLDRILKHPNGGWSVALPVLGAVIGHGLDHFLQAERARHVELARRNRALVRDLRAGPGDRRLPAAELASENPRRRALVDRRVGEGRDR